MPSAKLKFTQNAPGPGVGGDGLALVGVAGTAFTAANVDNTDVVNAQFEVLYSPPGSAITPGVKQAYSTASPPVLTSSWAAPAPDLAGGYVVRLRTKNGSGDEAVDDRVFAVLEDSGRFIPPYVGGRALNFLGQAFGWLPYVQAYLKAIDSNELRAGREYLSATTDNAAHALATLALPTSAIVLVEPKILAIKADASVAKWWKISKAFAHNGAAYTAGTLRNVDSETVIGTAPSWTVDLALSGSSAVVNVNGAGDSVQWYVSRLHVQRIKV